MKFLFMDETYNEETKPPITSLTGLLVPAESYSQLRKDLYQTINEIVKPTSNRINLSPPELHFNNFLPSIPDDDKFRILHSIVQTLVTNHVRVLRVGYYRTRQIVELFSKGEGKSHKLIELCWFGMQLVLGAELEAGLVVPVLDAGFSEAFQKIVAKFSQPVRDADIMTAIGLQDSVSISSPDNLGEVLYADSKYSILIQLTDVVAGLRRLTETVRVTGNPPNSKYKLRLLEIADELTPVIGYETIVQVEVN